MNSPNEESGANGRLCEVLAAYLEAEDAGWAPPPNEIVTCYPELEAELAAYFQGQDHVARLAESLPLPSPGEGQDAGWAFPASADAPTKDESASATNPSMESPSAFGDYVLRDQIDHGGMGVVFRAYKKSLDKEVALKMIRSGQFASPEEVRRFLGEVRHHASLDHPNIVPVYDGGILRGQPYFTMKLIEGGDLNRYLPQLAKNLKAAVDLLAKVARAVHYAHQRGILHRDLKPGNILIEGGADTPVDKLVPLVSDFGVAQRISARAHEPLQDTADGASYLAPEQIDAERKELLTTVAQLDRAGKSGVVGTPAYMPPEMASREKGQLSTAADVFSLGAILYRLLTGRPPFQAATRSATLDQVLQCEPVRPSKLKPRVDLDLEAVCMKCLAKEPVDRYDSALELAKELERWLRRESVMARPRSLPARAWRTVRRNVVVSVVFLLAGFAAGASFVAHYYLDPERPREDNEKELLRGRAVTLIGQTGPPRYKKLVPPRNGVFELFPNPALPYSLESVGNGYVQLMPSVPAEGYRFSAQVSHEHVFGHNDGQSDGYTGIYFAYSESGRESCWCELAFADLGILSQKYRGQVNSSVVGIRLYHREQGLNPVDEYYHHSSMPPFTHRFCPQGVTWRTLQVEVRPETVRAFWGEKPDAVLIGEVACEKIPRLIPGDQPRHKIPFTYDPKGGLGLIVSKGSAAFRQVVVEPLH